MKRLLLLLCLSAAVRPAAAQTAVSGFVCSLPERLARPLDDTLVVLRDLELLAPRRVMQSFDVVSDSTIYISQLGAFENHVPGRTRSHEVYVFEVRPGCDTMPRMTLRYFGHGANIAVEECGGTRYVWIDSNATRVGGEYWQSCTVSRVPFRAGSCCDHDGGETFYFDDGCFNLLPAVDRAHDLLSISYRKADGTHGFRHLPVDVGGVGAARHDAPRRADVGRRTVGRVRAYRRAGDPLSGFAAAHTGRRLSDAARRGYRPRLLQLSLPGLRRRRPLLLSL